MKMSEQQILELRCRLEKFITEREGMLAENRMREYKGDSLAYVETDFGQIYQKIAELENHICWLGER